MTVVNVTKIPQLGRTVMKVLDVDNSPYEQCKRNMNCMENNDLALKKMLVDMFAWFHQFCEQNNLQYYMLGGTLLGAIRHQGFIPWDDDIDVGMPRSDYQRLEALLKNRSERYVLETPNSENNDYYYPFSKLYDTETTLVENTRSKIKRGIYLDIFPLDGAGNTVAEGLVAFKRVKSRRLLLLSMTTGLRPGRSFYKNTVVSVMNAIPDWVINRKKLLISLDSLCARKPFEDCEWVVNFMGNWMEREMMPKQVFGKPESYIFENMLVYGPSDYEAYLSSLYGDWRQLPPVEQQHSHHDFLYLDLEHSYLNSYEGLLL